MSVIDEIKSRLNIVEVVSEKVALKKSGRNYSGFCPFHADTKSPSFIVFPETQTWRCFGACAEGGDVFSFVMKREGCDFKDALEVLARQAGVQLENANAQTSQENQLRHRLLELNAAAATYFHKLLTLAPAGDKARQYLAQRKITPETMATFQLGYALNRWDALTKYLVERGYSLTDLLAVGLLVEHDDGSSSYDRFRDRLMIPIRNPRGQVIGFGARALESEQTPKYLNSPQTILFDKGATLYGLDLARKHIHQADQVVIVEGYMDAIQAYQQGAKNVVAQMGTALTEPQLKQLAAVATKIVLALDSDAAGNAATIRSLSVLRHLLPKKQQATSTSRGIEFEAHFTQDIYVVSLPAGKDPDDVLREGLAVWQNLLAKAMPALDFYEKLILERTDIRTPQGKSFVVQQLMPIYREMKDEIERVSRVQRLARSIGLDERLLITELKGSHAKVPYSPKSIRSAPPDMGAAPTNGNGNNGKTELEEYCLALILTHPSTLAMANDMLEKKSLPGLTVNDFNRVDYREIFKSLQLWTASEVPKLEILVEMVGQLLGQQLTSLVNQWRRYLTGPLEQINRDLGKTILRLRLQNSIKKIEELTFLQRETSENGDVRRYMTIAEEYSRQRRQLEFTKNALSLMGQRLAETNLDK